MKMISKSDLIQNYQSIRAFTEHLCEPLEIEDLVVQSMPDVSPTRWHLAHTAWFFETFLLKPALADYKTPNDLYNFLFNSYYNAVGEQYPRPKRGLLSRPTLADIFDYRHHVDQEMMRLMDTLDEQRLAELIPTIVLGLNHEQQHQELMLTDIKHVLFQNPLFPSYSSRGSVNDSQQPESINWRLFRADRVALGFEGPGFSFDNETPQHDVLLPSFELADRLVTNQEYLAFIEDRAYHQAQLWLSDGWALIKREKWEAPLYWIQDAGKWYEFTLGGLLPLDLNAPVAHISYYEAEAYAQWAQARLPSEFEWEYVARDMKIEGNFADKGIFHPIARTKDQDNQVTQLFGDVWEWTRSPYTAYPGFKTAQGAIGEYNGKFMSSQMVLRGGSCVSSQNHLRPTYRNFFYPHSRWQFMGFRLAREPGGNK